MPSSSHGMVPLACVEQYGACTEESQLFLLSAVRELAAAAGYPEMTFIYPLTFVSYEKIAFHIHF